ncbi:MAG: hypothetical protein ABFC96_07045, partial [Thermoguttaceae bacterium]
TLNDMIKPAIEAVEKQGKAAAVGREHDEARMTKDEGSSKSEIRNPKVSRCTSLRIPFIA